MIDELIYELESRGANFIRTIDISMLSEKENRGYSTAVLIGIVLKPGYIYRLSKENIADCSKFSETEHRTDELAEWTADFIASKGYKASAQSEKNLLFYDLFDEALKTSPLPHKKIAMMAGLGWIGKNNLLITREYGCAFSMCSVLTDAPLPAENKPILMPECGKCTVCSDVCTAGVIHGIVWNRNINRDLIVDVYHCEACLKCLSNCPWTQKYMNNNITQH